jgi:hypothetical protein
VRRAGVPARVRFGHVEEELGASAGNGRVTGDQRLGNVLVVGQQRPPILGSVATNAASAESRIPAVSVRPGDRRFGRSS